MPLVVPAVGNQIVVVTLDYPVSLDFRWVGNLPYNPISLMGPKEVTDAHRFSLLLV